MESSPRYFYSPSYHVCCVEGCTEFAENTPHHEPLRSLIRTEDYDNPKYHRYMDARHHKERHDLGYKAFKEKYPTYDGITISEYRQSLRGV